MSEKKSKECQTWQWNRWLHCILLWQRQRSFIGGGRVNVASNIFLEFWRERFQLLQNNYKKPIVHSRVTSCLCFKKSPRAKRFFLSDLNLERLGTSL